MCSGLCFVLVFMFRAGVRFWFVFHAGLDVRCYIISYTILFSSFDLSSLHPQSFLISFLSQSPLVLFYSFFSPPLPILSFPEYLSVLGYTYLYSLQIFPIFQDNPLLFFPSYSSLPPNHSLPSSSPLLSPNIPFLSISGILVGT